MGTIAKKQAANPAIIEFSFRDCLQRMVQCGDLKSQEMNVILKDYTQIQTKFIKLVKKGKQDESG